MSDSLFGGVTQENGLCPKEEESPPPPSFLREAFLVP